MTPTDNRPCTCHPDDAPPAPCARRYALAECRDIQANVMDRAQSWLNAADERGINVTDENGYLAVIRDMMLEVVRLNERIAYLEPIFIAARNLTDGPAADPIADLCARLRYYGNGYGGHLSTVLEAAHALERLARENAALRAFYGDQHIRDRLANAEQVETENDALRAIVRAADAMRDAAAQHTLHNSRECVVCKTIDAFDAARAKVKLP